MDHVFGNSESLTAANYDPQAMRMEIRFRSGRSYTYTGVPLDVYEGLVTADSAGRYYLANIRGQF